MERRDILLAAGIGLVQFIVALEFLMVMPLGPWLTGDLDLPPSFMGAVAAATC